MSSVLRVIQKDLLGLNKSVDFTTGKFNTMKAAAIGAMGVTASAGMLKGLWDLAHAGSAVNAQLAKMQGAGYSASAVAANKAFGAHMAATIPGTTWAGNLGTIAMLRALLNNSAEARAAAPSVAKAEVAARVYGISAMDFQQLLKGLDIRGSFIKNGVLNVADLTKAANEGVAALAMSHGLLTGRQIFQFTRMEGAAATLGNLTRYLADNVEMMQTLGRTGGRGMQYFWKVLAGGGMTKAQALALESHGLVTGTIAHSGSGFAMKPGQLYGYNDLITKGPAFWLYHDLVPKLAAQGIKTPQGVATAMAGFPVTMQRALMFLLTNEAQVEKGAAQFRNAIQVNQYAVLMKNSPVAQMLAFTTAWTGLIQALGEPIVKPAYGILNDITASIRGLERVALANPGAVKVAGEAVGWFAGALGILSTLAISRAAISGLRFLGSYSGLGKVASGFAQFAVGGEAEAGMATLVGPLGLVALAAGINSLANSTANWLGIRSHYNLSNPHGMLAHEADQRWGAGHWHWQHSLLWGDSPARGAPTVNVGNTDQLARATAHHVVGAMRHALTLPAAHIPNVPTGAATPWSPGVYPASP